MRTFPPFQLLSIVITTTLAACGGGDLTLPADGTPASLRAMSGSGQQGTVGTKLPDPLVVRLTDGAARPVPGVTVDFRFKSDVSGARFEPATVRTDDTGFASVRVRLGRTAGDQTIEAAVAASASSALLTTFGVTVLSPPASGPPGTPGGGGGNTDDD